MSLPKQLHDKYARRFDELIAEGEAIIKGIKVIPGHYDRDYWQSGGRGHQRPDVEKVNWPQFVKWRANSVSLLDSVIPKNHANRELVDGFKQIRNKRDQVEWGVATLLASKDDFDNGFFSDLSRQVEAEIAGNYMGQAENLLSEGHRGKFDHVPAAVLAGAVLEKTLRSLAQKQNPPIDLLTPKGEPKTMNPLIDELKKAGVFVETKAKQLRGWAGIRNDAAHGAFDKFTRPDVEVMLKGIESFLADFA